MSDTQSPVHMRYQPGTPLADRWPGCVVIAEGRAMAVDINAARDAYRSYAAAMDAAGLLVGGAP